MAEIEGNPQELLKKSLEGGRIDVLRSILVELGLKKEFHEIVDSPAGTDVGTLLHYAASQGNADGVRALLTSGANPCVQNDEGKTPLHCAKNDSIRDAFTQELLQAVAQSKLGRVCQLLSSGVSIDALDSPISKNTALHWAASFGTEDVVKVLCEGGAPLTAANGKGDTPLHDAVLRGNVAIVRRLLQYGADPATKNLKGEDAYELAKLKPDILQCLSMHNVSQGLRKSESTDSLETSSIASLDRAPMLSPPTSPVPKERFLLAQEFKMAQWTDILWPQPKQLVLGPGGKVFAIPEDRKIRVYFHSASEADPRQMMQIWTLFVTTLTASQLGLEWMDYECASETANGSDSHSEESNQSGASNLGLGGITCGVLRDIFDRDESYSMTVRESGISIWASDLTGLKHGLSTFVQILRKDSTGSPKRTLPATVNDTVQQQQQHTVPSSLVTLPCMVVRDSPDTKFRGIFIDFTGCRVFSVDTVCKVVNRLAYCKANQLIIHFEVRPTDKFALPYTSRELFHLRQVCEDLRVKLIPSLDLNTSSADKNTIKSILGQFLKCFPHCKGFHFGTHLAPLLAKHPALLEMVHYHYSSMVYLSFESFASLKGGKMLASKRPLPAYCIVCLPGQDLIQEGPQQELAKSSLGGGICLKFTTSDVGYLCQAPETMVKNAILAAKLGQRCPVLGTMICDLSTGCEIMPQSLAFLSEVAVLGVSWNRETDMKRFCFLLPQICAEHILLDRSMAAVFQQILTLGYVEHELTKLGYGYTAKSQPHGAVASNGKSSGVGNKGLMNGYAGGNSGQGSSSLLVGMQNGPMNGGGAQFSHVTGGGLSVIVQLLLNPDSMSLERLTPVTFKKARVELTRSLHQLNTVKKDLPYNYELALTLAEIQLVTELMILATKMGQAISIHGSNPHPSDVSFPVINAGVANLPLTTRTDLANSLLELRSKFQHTWLSRNQPDSLANAVKIFDNLFRTLLPPDMQSYGDNLL